uniref:Uncharacterized protein n=1 Tax=Mastacembelus armatus TaxID=205130 RepID=A0A3Q3NIL8_9TELE
YLLLLLLKPLEFPHCGTNKGLSYLKLSYYQPPNAPIFSEKVLEKKNCKPSSRWEAHYRQNGPSWCQKHLIPTHC